MQIINYSLIGGWWQDNDSSLYFDTAWHHLSPSRISRWVSCNGLKKYFCLRNSDKKRDFDCSQFFLFCASESHRLAGLTNLFKLGNQFHIIWQKGNVTQMNLCLSQISLKSPSFALGVARTNRNEITATHKRKDKSVENIGPLKHKGGQPESDCPLRMLCVWFALMGKCLLTDRQPRTLFPP